VNPLVQVNVGEVQRLIHDRLSRNANFRAVLSVAVDKYPDGLFATVWVGQEPDEDMRQYAAQLETELAEHGTPCSILLKSEKGLAHGGRYRLATRVGEFWYRNYRVDPIGDEDWVFVVSLYRGDETYRFRVSLTRTLASMLRGRDQLDERRILEVYLEEIKGRLEQGVVERDKPNEIMFGSRDVSRFAQK
jgi:hypothetical protein